MEDAGETPAGRYFADLYDLASDDERSLEEKIDRAIEIGCERLGTTNGVLSYTGSGKYEVVESTIGTGPYAPGGTSALETTWCRHVTERREVVGFGDVTESEYAEDVAREATGLHCYLGAPILVDNEVFGTLCFSGEEPRERDFTVEERQFVRLLAQWIAYELERDKHHRELSAQNRRLDEFVGIAAHDLRNPLSTVKGYTELAIEDAEGQQREFLETVAEAADRMDELISDLLRLAREGGDVGERSEIALDDAARQAWGMVSTGNATLDIRTDTAVYANRSRLHQLFENLFRNAVEHCSDGVTVTVEDCEGGFVVSDNGTGMPEHIAERLFDEGLEREAGLGLGLLIIERIVDGHGWTASVHSDGGGTTFEFRGVGQAPPGIAKEGQTA